MPRDKRRIVVSREFFEHLKGYLQSDERFTKLPPPEPGYSNPLYLLTPVGKSIEFVYEL